MIPESTAGAAGAPERPSPLGGWYADPALVTLQDRWWLYPTTDGLPGWGANSFRAFSSTDLVDWVDHGEILRLGVDVTWATERAWAPAMAERDGRYFLYFTANNNIGVAVGDAPEGPFRDIGQPLVADGAFGGTMIDPSVFTDDDGARYLYWGNGVAHGVRLDKGMTSFDPDAVHSWQPRGFREAAWVHRRGDVYFLSWSEDDTRSEDYRVRYATSDGPLGPWRHQGLLLTKNVSRGILGTGHHSIARVPGTDDWIIAFHRFAIPDGGGYRREVVFAPLEHETDTTLAPVRFPREPLSAPLTPPHHQQKEK